MTSQVEEIHLICRNSLNVTSETDTHFTSEWWVVAERHVKPGVLFALHQEKESPSYLHGKVEGPARVDEDSDKNRRIQVVVRRTSSPMPWKGGGSGTVGYLWTGGDFGALPVVPTVLPEFLGGGNRPMKSLFEAEKFSWPKAAELNARRATGRVSNRLANLGGILSRMAGNSDCLRISHWPPVGRR